jgi:hypothetical protein
MRYSILLLFPALLAGQAPRVTIDGRRTLGELPAVTRYVNTSLRFAPPHELAERVEREYGRPRVVRCWLPLDDMWDYRDARYYFNFQLGLDRYQNDTVKHKYDRGVISATDRYYYDHLAAFSRHADAILLNVRRYEHEVTRGILTMAKWKEVVKTGLVHYKQRYPNIRYIEALNEYHHNGFGGLQDAPYYEFYRTVYEIVNEVNDELKPAIPLEAGGPNVVGSPLTADPNASDMGRRLVRFFENYAKDPNPRKRLDFVSFHDYGLGKNPAAIEQYESIVRRWLGEHKLRQDLPFFETEIGYAGPRPKPELNQNQATGMSTLFYWTRHSKQHRLFPWCLFHEPARQLSLTAFLPDLRMTPFGAALKMWAMQKTNEVSVEWKPQLQGVYAVASADAGGMAIQMWNDTAQPASAEVVLAGVPRAVSRAVRLREYRIDSKNSNCLLVPESKGDLALVREAILAKAPGKWTVALEPYSLALWVLEPRSKSK